MKIFNYIIAVMAFLAVSSCVDDDKLFSLDDFPVGALPNFAATANDDGFVGLGEAANFNMEFSVDFANNLEQSGNGKVQGSGRVSPNLEFAEVRALDIEVMWTDISTGNSFTGVLGTTETWPITLSYTGMDIVNAISELNSPDDFELGDLVTVAGGVNFADGNASPAFVPNPQGQPTLAYSASFAGQPGLSLQIQYAVACISSLDVEVDYEILQAIDAAGLNAPLQSGTFTWVANVNGNYNWPSYSWGTYQNAYGCCEQVAGGALTITDLCGDLSITPADGYGCAWSLIVDSVEGSVLTVTLSGANGGCFGLVQIQMTRTDGLDWPPLF